MGTFKAPTLGPFGWLRDKHLPPNLRDGNIQTFLADEAADPASPLAGELSATFVPRWKATTAYLAGDKVLSPAGDVVSAKVDFTSGASFNASNWNYSATYSTPAAVATEKVDAIAQARAYTDASSFGAGRIRNIGAEPVTGRSAWPHAGGFSDGVATWGRFQNVRMAVVDAVNPVLVFANSYGDEASTPATATVTYKAAIEYPMNSGNYYKVYFNGRRDGVCEPESIVRSSPVGLILRAGVPFMVITTVTVASGDKWVYGAVTAGGPDVGATELGDTGTGTAPLPEATPKPTGANVYTVAPAVILATPAANYATKKVRGLVADSKGTGSGDTVAPFPYGGKGYFNRRLGALEPALNLAVAGSKASTWKPINRRTKQALMNLVDDWTVDLVTNDLSANDSLDTIQANIIAVWNDLVTIAPVHQVTITPSTTSTDGWATLANQSVKSFESVRVAYNNWVRDGAPMDGGVALAAGATTGHQNLLTPNQSSFETDMTGWVTAGNATFSRSTAWSSDGTASCLWIATAAGTDSPISTLMGTSGIPVVAGRVYTGSADIRARDNARSCYVQLYWYDSTGAQLTATTPPTTSTSSTTVTTRLTVTGTAPTGAVYGAVRIRVTSPAAGDGHYADRVSLNRGTNTVWALGGTSPNPALRAGQSGHPLVGFYEFADATESARDSGKWRVDQGIPTTDGVHPSTAMHQNMGATIPLF